MIQPLRCKAGPTFSGVAGSHESLPATPRCASRSKSAGERAAFGPPFFVERREQGGPDQVLTVSALNLAPQPSALVLPRVWSPPARGFFVLSSFSSVRYRPPMPDDEKLSPADPGDIAGSIAFALLFSGRKRVHDSDQTWLRLSPTGSCGTSSAPDSLS